LKKKNNLISYGFKFINSKKKILMKNIKYIAILVFQCALVQFTFAQSADNNGRSVDSKPGPVAKTETPSSVTKDMPNKGSYSVDLDVPGALNDKDQKKKEDVSYPIDLEIMKDEIMASSNSEVDAQKMNELTTLVDDLRQLTEELRLENRVIRESLNNCCSSNTREPSASDAFLLQNAPNPFNESAEIRYFIPEGLEDVEIRIYDIKGSVMSTIQLNDTGDGKLAVDSNTLAIGTFVYTLSVRGKIIDSKVMIVTQ
jgi:hypothetical protein